MSVGVSVKVGNTVPLSCQLESLDTTKFVRCSLVDEDGNAEAGSPFTLPHVGGGLYSDGVGAQPDKFLFATYIVYDDAGFTIQSSLNLPTVDVFSPVEANINRVITDLTGEVETTGSLLAELASSGEVIGEIDDVTLDGFAFPGGDTFEGELSDNDIIEGEKI